MAAKVYDRRYFDRWYRTPRQRTGLRSLLERKVALALAVAEYHLGHPVRSVLDVGCGEGAWRAPLLKARPKLHYLGVDASEYAVARHGMRRNLKLARFGQLAELRFGAPVDLLVCADVLHYLDAAEIRFLQMLRARLEVDKLTAAAIERSAIARFRRAG